MAKKEKNHDPIREAKAVYSAPAVRAGRTSVLNAPTIRTRGAYKNELLADSIAFGCTISVPAKAWPGANRVKGRSKIGWPNGGKSFRKLAATKAANEAKAARDAAEQARREGAKTRHIEWLKAHAKALPPEEQLDFLSQHTRPSIATQVMEQLSAE
jgi:hypothetical protein